MNLLGIDGGQTSTKVCLFIGKTGQCLIRTSLPIDLTTMTRRQKGKAGVQQCLQSLVAEADFAGTIRMAFISISGLYEEHTEMLKSWILECVPVEQFRMEGDARANLAGASAGRNDGVLIIAGGGSFGYYRSQETEITAGGFGHVLGDEGSAYWIGLRALHAAIRCADGRGAPTLLHDSILHRWNVPSFWSVKKKIHTEQLDSTDVARLSVLVDRCAESGDAAAQAILREAGAELALLAVAILRQANAAALPAKRVYPTGGVFQSKRWVMEAFAARLNEYDDAVEVAEPIYAPVIGTIILAAAAAGYDLAPDRLRGVETIGGD